jgi:hypothetical protein
VDIRSMTFFHYLEEDLDPGMPFSPFTKEWFTLSVRDPEGRVWPVSMRLYDPVVSRQRDVRLMVPDLNAHGVWHEGRVGRLSAVLLKCHDVQRVATTMAAEGRFCYDHVPRLALRDSTRPAVDPPELLGRHGGLL